MRNFFWKIAMLFCAGFLNACVVAFHHGSLTGNDAANPDYRPVDFANGYSKATRVLGFGGLNKDALVLEAKRNLYLSNRLEEGQIFSNFTIDFKESFYLLVVHTTSVTVSADILETDPSAQFDSSSFYEKIKTSSATQSITTEITRNSTQYKLGDTVYFYLGVYKQDGDKTSGKIVELLDETAKVSYKTDKGKTKFSKIPYVRLSLENTQ